MDISVYDCHLGYSDAHYCKNLLGSLRLKFGKIPMKNNLRALRKARALSQAEMGKLLEVSRQTINSIETGKYDPSLPLAFKIAHYFELSIEEMFTPN